MRDRRGNNLAKKTRQIALLVLRMRELLYLSVSAPDTAVTTPVHFLPRAASRCFTCLSRSRAASLSR